jgi:tetratricopeptide (TPR) repeat protein
MKKSNSKLKRLTVIFGIILAVPVVFWLVYQIPWVHKKLEWRLDAALTYLRQEVNPAGNLPTPLPSEISPSPVSQTTIQITPTLESTPIPQNTPISISVPTSTPIPDQVKLPSPAFDRYHDIQDWNNCGPATMALYLRFYGWKGDQFTISDVVKPIRADRNVNIDELQYYVRTQAGWLNAEFRVGGDLTLLKQIIAAGYPVMIEEAFLTGEQDFWPGDDHWTGHYLLLTGYDDTRQVFISQDTMKGPDRVVNYLDVDKNWQAFNRVYMIIYPADQTSTIQTLLGSNWDESTNRQHALSIAEQETKSDPHNEFAWFNYGSNLTYFEKYVQAAQAYDQARTIGLPQRILRYQFGPFIAYFNAGRIDDLITLTEYALKRTPNSEEALVWHGWSLFRNGDSVGAAAEFHKALDAHPGFQDAIYGLNYLGNP